MTKENCSRNLTKLLDQKNRDERRLTDVIGRADQIIDILRENLSGKIGSYSSEGIAELLSPFETYEANKSNPYRNIATLLREDVERRGIMAVDSSIRLPFDNPNYFFLRLFTNPQFAAGFNPIA